MTGNRLVVLCHMCDEAPEKAALHSKSWATGTEDRVLELITW